MNHSKKFTLVAAIIMVVLFALNMRVTTANFTPMLDSIEQEFAVSSVLLGIIGSMAPLCFSLFGILTPIINRFIGLNLNVVFALLLIAAGHLIRGVAGDTVALTLGVAVSMCGMGIGNVLMPAIVKKYFPQRIALMTSIYATLLSVSTFVPPLWSAATVADTGWRFHMLIYIPLALACLLPWLFLVRQHLGKDVRALRGVSQLTGPIPLITNTQELVKPRLWGFNWKPSRLWRSLSAWAMVVAFACSSFSGYTMLAWLPLMLQDLSGYDAPSAGIMVALYATIGIPTGLIIPMLALRMKHPGNLVIVGGVLFAIGASGFMFFPTVTPWLWTMIHTSGQIIFPLMLVLIMLRTRTEKGAISLGGFVNGWGYLLSACGPILFGLLHLWSGNWQAPLMLLYGASLLCLLAGLVLHRNRILEDEHPGRAG
ncbi:MAG: MFS transporter [Microbacteriaceae bacterium]